MSIYTNKTTIKLKLLAKIFYAMLVVIVACIAGLAVLSITGFPGIFKVYVVQSGSMEPAIKTGSLVFVTEKQDYNINDIITYKASSRVEGSNTLTVTHRIIDKKTVNDEAKFTTKGDANNVEDLDKVSPYQIIGKLSF